MRIKLPTSPPTAGYFFRCINDPMGLARLISNARLFSADKDSGNTKYPYKQLAKAKPAATIKGIRSPISPRNPPKTGPITNPNPKAAPIIPKFLARFSAVLISAI